MSRTDALRAAQHAVERAEDLLRLRTKRLEGLVKETLDAEDAQRYKESGPPDTFPPRLTTCQP